MIGMRQGMVRDLTESERRTFSWSSPTFGQPGANVHVATSGNYGNDPGHDDGSNGDD